MMGLGEMARVALFGVLCAGLAIGCTDDALERGRRYVDDPVYRERALEESLVVDDNLYARIRLGSYSTSWAALSEHDPPVRPLMVGDIGRFARNPQRTSTPEEGALAPVLGRATGEWTEESLLALGRRAFEEYPVQITEVIGATTDARDTVDRFGLWVDGRGRVGGLVRVHLADGSERFAVTCATCHARPDASGALVHGVANERFDWGAILYRDQLELGRDPEEAAAYAEWGPGQVDVTPDDTNNPAGIPDLRAVRHQPYLHWAGTLVNDLVALAIRIETLLITSSRAAVRPPREVAFALALYVWRMGEPGHPGDADAEPRGAALFARRCGSCHGADGSTPTARIEIDRIGTDPAVGESITRGTGFYRVPSLWRVGERSQLLHDGRVESLESLLDRDRLDEVPGHAFGTDLDTADRAALLAFVRTIGAQ
jgi:mono/diheme cytochrome c family protein